MPLFCVPLLRRVVLMYCIIYIIFPLVWLFPLRRVVLMRAALVCAVRLRALALWDNSSVSPCGAHDAFL